MNSITAQSVADWFLAEKAPCGLIEPVALCLTHLASLDEGQKKLMGLMLFSYSMAMGPFSFHAVEELARAINVHAELKFYVHDWLDSVKRKGGGE